MQVRHWLLRLMWCPLALWLTACAVTRPVDSEVRSYSRLQTLPSPPTYRLELLPSQAAQAASFAVIEGLAEQALARVGLRRNDSQAKLLLQISVHSSRASAAAVVDNIPFYSRWGLGIGGGLWGGGLLGLNWSSGSPVTRLQRREVSLLLRDLASWQIVYETSAVYEGAPVSEPAIFGLLFDAALTDFPRPSNGPRQVKIKITPADKGAAPAPAGP